MKNRMSFYGQNGLALLAAGLLSTSSFAQQQRTDGDTLKPKETVVTKGFRADVAKANKLHDKPDFVDISAKKPNLKYGINSVAYPTKYDVKPVKAARLKGQPLKKLYRGYMKAGGGNYSTSYGEVFINNLRSRETNQGLHLKHLASTGKLENQAYAAYTQQEIELWKTKFFKKHSLTGNFAFNRDVNHFYGFNPDTAFAMFDSNEIAKDAIRQRFLKLGGDLVYKSYYKDSNRINHETKLAYYNLQDLRGGQENQIELSGKYHRFFDTEQAMVQAGLNANNIQFNDGTAYTNFIFGLKPQIITRRDKFRLDLGLNFNLDADSAQSFHFYPAVEGRYSIVEDLLVPYGGIKGGIKRWSYDDIRSMNPFVVNAPQLRNQNELYNWYFGIRGSYSSKISFKAQGGKIRTGDMPFFVNTGALQNRFEVIYDTVTALNFNGELSYQNGEKLKLIARGEFNQYTMESEFEAWHMPTWRVTLGGHYDIQDKLIIRAEVFAISATIAKLDSPLNADKTYGTTGVFGKNVDGTYDINLGIEYRYNSVLSAFVDARNLAGIRYQRWHRYPSQGINILGGIAFRFGRT